jgi:glycosyltransferase involved in cell wall biosynthesis
VKVLVITAMYPSAQNPARGTFVKDQVESLREAGVEVDVLAFNAQRKGNNYLKAVGDLRRQLRVKRYDIIHAHYGLTGFVARMQTQCPVVVTFHGSDLLAEVEPTWKGTLGSIKDVTVSKLIAYTVSKRIIVAEILRPQLWPLDAVKIPMGVDISLFKPMPRQEARERLGLPHDKRLVVFVAHPRNYVKRFDLAQAAVQRLAETSMDVELLALYQTPHEQVPIYMNACDALVLTSMHEASPCVIKEAMACNLPIVSVNVGDVAERMDGVEGCYLCDRTPQDIAAKLRRVLEDGRHPDSRSKIAELSLQNVARQVIAVYEEMLSKGRTRPA